MADRTYGMESAVPAKRPRLDFPEDTSSQQYDSDFHCFAGTSELLTGGYSNGAEFTITSDSGFNELTPPQSLEDDITTPRTSSSQDENIGRIENHLSNDNTNDSSIIDCSENWPNGTATSQEEDEDEEDRQSVASTTSNLSGLSDFSNFSGKDWKPCAGPMSWVQQQMLRGVNPRTILTHVLGATTAIPEGVPDVTLWRLIVNMLSEPPRREKLRHINTIEDVVRLMKSCRKIIVLTGAGVSVSCGIPDFRSRDGIYARLAIDFPDLPDPQAMFDIHYFRRDPRPFFKFAREIYPGQFTPSLCHRFIRLIEQHNKLLRNYTQNIDTLEQVAGIENVIQCHGSFATATCQRCNHRVNAQGIKEDIFSQRIPRCTQCDTNEENGHEDLMVKEEIPNVSQDEPVNTQQDTTSSIHLMPHRPPDSPQFPPQPIMKPDIVFFGEGLPDEFHDKMAEDKDECDLLIVIGSSLKVRPVALIPSSVPSHVPQILINREPLRHLTFDVELLGDCDVIINELCHRLGNGWKKLCADESMTEIKELPPRPLEPPSINISSADGEDTNAFPGTALVAPQNAPHPRDESDIEALRACWAPKVRETVASRLPDNMFLYTGGHKYIFPGAEVYYDPDDEFEETKSHSSESDTDEIEPREESQESFHSNHTNGSSSHHPRLDEEFHSTETPHLSPEDVDSLLSTADNGQSQEHVEDWTSLNASLDTSLDCDHTLTGYETDSAHHTEESASKIIETITRCSPSSDL
ncbi:NAD-dependent protein deacetylase sirtuin-1-like [Homarus americanus]|uniref:protein acetyllysine N-acetyltransferase n=1 Tax=Homarus americanus TaxID=6706 RepID=A0A8J5K6N6_HOMAM|nr:NAD-dependent protein deacetylase sirtuin-1-like [Homarus americanus]KAG7165969.1 NAD-dependent protein deacetylase sirtuin-1-like [Homarus americanus]